MRGWAACVLGLVSALGCTETHTVPEPDGALVRPDAGTVRSDAGPGPGRMCSDASSVDVLLVIDNSNSMTEEQATLAEQLPRFVAALLEPPDRDGDGEPDWLPVKDLQLGVVTTDMGSGGFTVMTCDEATFGDDGILRSQGNVGMPGCMATYPPFLSARPGDDPVEVAQDFTCIAQMGTGGCGFEQQLEAALKALTPSTSPVTFFMGTRGHADRANAGFVRPDSLLAVLVLTDEEDCSAADPELFNPSSGVYPGDLNLRCFSYPTAVHPVERYVEGLLALRSGRPELLLYATITGVPPDLVAEGSSYDAILTDPRMQERVDPDDSSRLVPSCDVPGVGLAYPPRRLVRTAQQLEARGAHAIVESICQADYSAAVAEIAQRIGRNACAP